MRRRPGLGDRGPRRAMRVVGRRSVPPPFLAPVSPLLPSPPHLHPALPTPLSSTAEGGRALGRMVRAAAGHPAELLRVPRDRCGVRGGHWRPTPCPRGHLPGACVPRSTLSHQERVRQARLAHPQKEGVTGTVKCRGQKWRGGEEPVSRLHSRRRSAFLSRFSHFFPLKQTPAPHTHRVSPCALQLVPPVESGGGLGGDLALPP